MFLSRNKENVAYLSSKLIYSAHWMTSFGCLGALVLVLSPSALWLKDFTNMN